MILAVFALLVVVFIILPLVGWAIGLVIWTAIVGIFLGALGRLIVPGYQPIGILATICCGWVALWSGTHRGQVAGRSRGAIQP